MIQPYKNDLKRVDAEIDTYKKTVDLYELETAKEDLFKRFQETFLDIQARIEKIRPSISLPSTPETKPIEPKPTPAKTEPTETTPEENLQPKEKPPREKARNKAEEKIETIREEVLKAMERLEQIETEG
jgi:predicted  nucleic acid-binding Zn-ribbon protein